MMIDELTKNMVSEVKISYANKIPASKRVKITKASEVFTLVSKVYQDIGYVETVKLLLLNRTNHVLGLVNLSKGGTNGCIIDVKVVLQHMLKANAENSILIHNHPSGNLSPSESDKAITRKVKEACSYLDMHLLDHVIVSEEEFFSFADEGIL